MCATAPPERPGLDFNNENKIFAFATRVNTPASVSIDVGEGINFAKRND